MQLVLMASTNDVIYPSDDTEQRAQHLSETELTIPQNSMKIWGGGSQCSFVTHCDFLKDSQPVMRT